MATDLIVINDEALYKLTQWIHGYKQHVLKYLSFTVLNYRSSNKGKDQQDKENFIVEDENNFSRFHSI